MDARWQRSTLDYQVYLLGIARSVLHARGWKGGRVEDEFDNLIRQCGDFDFAAVLLESLRPKVLVRKSYG